MPRSPNRLEPDHGFAWHDSAACRGQDLSLFFGVDGERAVYRVLRERKAKRLCRDCPVKQDCLEDALAENLQHGVWGAASPDERKVMRRKRLREARAA